MKEYRLLEIQSHIERNDLLYPLDILLVGATGTGKSSTLNALFNTPIAKIGYGVNPETQEIAAYPLHDYLRIHDSAGLGDGKVNDLKHTKNITSTLLETRTIDDVDWGFIDLVMVILDGGSRDLGTTFNLIEHTILKSIEPQRVIVVINQADMAMKGRNWNSGFNKPEPDLIDFLEEKASSIKGRINESTGLTIRKPVYYSAKYEYNINALIDHIIDHFPTKRRIPTKPSFAGLPWFLGGL